MSQINVTTIRSRTGGPPALDKGVVVTGIVTATTGNITGNLTVGGELSYEDVTNVDSVGVVTAGKGFRATTGGVIVTAGVSTFSADINASAGLDVDGHTELDDVNIAGVGTFNGNVHLGVSGGQILVNTNNNGGNVEYPLIVSGRANDAADSGRVNIKRGTAAASMSAGDSIGDITFTALDGGNAAMIAVKAGTGWGGTSDSPGELYFSTTPDGSGTLAERMRITSNGGLLLSNGILVERCKIVTTAWSTTNDISLDDGNVFLNTANLAGTTNTIDITSSNGLNVDLAVGDMTSVTLITAVNAATAYINEITIGAGAVTESWVGGSAPTDGGSSGYDVYTFNIIKTAASTYVVIANQVKGS